MQAAKCKLKNYCRNKKSETLFYFTVQELVSVDVKFHPHCIRHFRGNPIKESLLEEGGKKISREKFRLALM
jgi:hypothetical protein